MKDKATAVFRRLSHGYVIGEIINERGEVVETKNFGEMTEAEYLRTLKLLEQEHPDVGAIEPIELTGN